MPERKKLGEILVRAGAISERQLKEALEDQKKYGGRLGAILLERRYIDEKAFLNALSQQLKIPAVDFSKSSIPEPVIHLVPKEIQEKHLVFPIAIRRTATGNSIVLAMSDPTNVEVQDQIRFMTEHRVESVLALESVLKQVIREYWYRQEGKGSFRYTPDMDIGAWEPRPMELDSDRRLIPSERVIDFNEMGKTAAQTEAGPEKPKLTQELTALLRLLVKKRIITEKEYLEELKKIK